MNNSTLRVIVRTGHETNPDYTLFSTNNKQGIFMKLFSVIFVLMFSGVVYAKSAKISFVAPKNGQTVPATFKVQFGLAGMKIRPAGEDVNDKTTGHHHLIIDGAFVPEGQVVPTDDTHKHFGKGQTETEITLTKGKHTLTLQLADGAHVSYGKNLSTTVEVTVK